MACHQYVATGECWKFTVVHDDRTLMCHGNVAGHIEGSSWYTNILR
jgi:hypothetical protein